MPLDPNQPDPDLDNVILNGEAIPDRFVPDAEPDNMEDHLDAVEDIGLDPEEVVEPDPDAFRQVEELPFGRRGRPFSHSQVRTYTRRWRVLLKPGYRDYGPVAVIQAPGLPWPYSVYVSANGVEYDEAALLVDYDAEQEDQDDWQRWIVTGTYSTDLGDTGPNFKTLYGNSGIGPQNNPELERPTIEWDSEETVEAPQFDLDGRPFVNSAGQPFTPAPTFPVGNPVLVIVRNVKRYDSRTYNKYAFAVNDDMFLGNPPGTCQCVPPRAKLMYRGAITYHRVTFRIRIKTNETVDADGVTLVRETWQPKILDAGMYQKETRWYLPSFGDLTPIYDKQGHAMTQPTLLDGNGRAQAPVVGPDGIARKTPVWIYYRRFPTRSFNVLFNNIFNPP
jgi:hypothetical protein